MRNRAPLLVWKGREKSQHAADLFFFNVQNRNQMAQLQNCRWEIGRCRLFRKSDIYGVSVEEKIVLYQVYRSRQP